jgi:hypothetical protein
MFMFAQKIAGRIMHKTAKRGAWWDWVHTCNPSYRGGRGRESQSEARPEQKCETPSEK